jgi:hypothetical protein
MPEENEELDFVDPSLCFHVEDGPETPLDESVVSGATDDVHIIRKSTVESKGNNVIRIHEVHS